LCFEESGRLSLTFEELIDKNLNKSADKENID